MTDSEEEEDLSKEVNQVIQVSQVNQVNQVDQVNQRQTPSLTELLDLNSPSYNTFKMAQVEGGSPADVSERTDSGLGLNFENLELSLSRETLQLSRENLHLSRENLNCQLHLDLELESSSRPDSGWQQNSDSGWQQKSDSGWQQNSDSGWQQTP